MSYVGDDAALRRLITSLGTLAQAPQAARSEMRDEALRLIQAGFDASRAPDGTAWAALKTRAGKPLDKSGTLRGSIRANLSGRLGLAFSASAPYAAHHQYGAPRAKVPARPFLPGRDLPPAWAAAFERILDAHLRRHLGQ